MSQTTEPAFETYVQKILVIRSGWKPGTNAEWDKTVQQFVTAFNREPPNLPPYLNPSSRPPW